MLGRRHFFWVLFIPLIMIGTASAKGSDEQRSQSFAQITQQYEITTATAGIIHEGALTWSAITGEVGPGAPASSATLFNVASLTKLITAETTFRLVAKDMLELDTPFSDVYVDPDLSGDTRHQALTPKLALTHTTGFPNWRFFLPDNTLTFQNSPGSAFGYSGEGFEYLQHYLEHRFKQHFPDLVAEHLLQPLNMRNTFLRVERKNLGRIAHAKTQHGEWLHAYCRPGGWCRSDKDYSAADDLVTTVDDFAKLLIHAAQQQSHGLGPDRTEHLIAKGSQSLLPCDNEWISKCPQAQGFGLGWEVLKFQDHTYLFHGGSDWSQLAVAYVKPASMSGILIFLNGLPQNTHQAMPKLIRLLDPESPIAEHYDLRLSKMRAQQN